MSPLQRPGLPTRRTVLLGVLVAAAATTGAFSYELSQLQDASRPASPVPPHQPRGGVTKAWWEALPANVHPGTWLWHDRDALLADEAGVIHAINPESGPRWRFQTGGIVQASLLTVAGFLIVPTGLGPPTGPSTGDVVALNISDGQEAWRFPTGGYVNASPVLAAGSLFIGSNDGHVYRLDPSTGRELWRSPKRDQVHQVLVLGDPALVLSSSFPSIISADRIEDGSSVWSGDAQSHVQNLFETVEPGLLLVERQESAFTKSALLAVTAATGEVRWSRQFEDLSASLTTGPVVICAAKSEVMALDQRTGEPRWKLPVKALGAGLERLKDMVLVTAGSTLVLLSADGRVAWRHELGYLGVQEERAVLSASDSQNLYVGTTGGQVLAIGVQSGETVWRHELETPSAVQIQVADGVVYVWVYPDTVVRIRDGVALQ